MQRKCYRAFWAAATVLVSAVSATGSSSAGYEGTFTGSQAVAFRNALAVALNGVNSQKFVSQFDKDSALTEAMERIATQTIRSAGIGSAGVVTSEIIAITATTRVPPTDVGQALANVAVQISPCSTASRGTECQSAMLVARTIANEGTGIMADAFATTVTKSGGSVDLAAAALGAPQITSAIPGSVSGHPTFGSVVPPAPPPACGNPSCS